MPQITANSVTTHFDRTGSGPPLVLLHGGEADHTMFAAFAPVLAQRFCVIAPDQRDSGLTNNPTDAYGLNELADDVALLIRTLGHPRAHVFGTSFGGQVAQVLAARHPTVIDRLVLSSTWRVGASPLAFAPEVFGTLAALRQDTAKNAPEIARFFLSDEALGNRPELIEIFRGGRRTAAQTGRRSAVLTLPADRDLRSFDRPTLIIAGERDRLIPNAETLAIAELLPRAEVRLLPGVSHIGAIEAPQIVAEAVIDFLCADSIKQTTLAITGRMT